MPAGKRRLEMLSREMLALQTSGELNFYESDALECLLKSYSIISEVVDKLERPEWNGLNRHGVPIASLCMYQWFLMVMLVIQSLIL